MRPLRQESTHLRLGVTSSTGKVAAQILQADGQKPDYGSNSGIPAGSPPPTLLPTGIPGPFPRGLGRRASVTRTGSEAPRVLDGEGPWRPPHNTLLYSRLYPCPRSQTHCSALPEWALSGPRAERTSRSLCAGARARPPLRSACAPQTGSTRSRAGQVRPPLPPACVEPRALPGRTSPAGCAEALRASMRPQSRCRQPRSPPHRGDSSRFEFTTARPVPSPPAGSQRHVTTGAAEGQSWAPAGSHGRRAGWAGQWSQWSKVPHHP